ncbi:hypothetical protein LTR37_013534 [Vermiconidia calcicola]|uniref:Uncharacterized protein n=1 Tax=Vermiconidia calcicola TaxID=1690605 RepID=A0ACC3MWB0_9PEZI|nr:hypothetical protein LTR37_013534 [Vermiconidia calcicola]
MDQHDPSRRQYAPLTYTTQQPQQGSVPATGQYAIPGAVDRFRQSGYLQGSPSSASATGRASNDAQQVYGFAQGAQYGTGTSMQQGSVQYGQEMQSSDAQRQQSQHYSQYGSNMVYGIPQQATVQSPYEQVPSYRSRTNTAPEILATQFGVPQSGQYYLAGQPGTASAPAPELSSQHIPSQYSQNDTYPQPGPSSAQAYPSAMMDPSQSGGYPTYSQQTQYQSQPQQQPHTQPVDQAFERYQTQIRSIFTLARDGALRDVGSPLLDISHYLLGNAEVLGLTRDDEHLHDDRVRLWDEFNRAWLVTLQRQFDMTQEVIQANQPLREPQSLMTAQTLDRLSSELVRLCDSVERHGLVDYQIGVSEEEIMDCKPTF